MEVISLAIADVKVLIPKRHGDHRGFFSEVYNYDAFAKAGIDLTFLQDNHSMSGPKGTLRGLHYQLPPMAQGKLIRVTKGAILDVAVDIRRGSPTFGQHVTDVVSAENWKQIFVPAGFAHGFVTLEPDTEVIYKVNALYSPPHERGIAWNDPALAIDWRINPTAAILSVRDTKHPLLREQPDLFP